MQSPNRCSVSSWIKTCLLMAAIVMTASVTQTVRPVAAVAADEVAMSPNTVGAQIPSGYRSLLYTMADGDWTASFALPVSAQDGDVVNFRTSATFSTKLTTDNTDVGSSITFTSGDSMAFAYDAARDRWVMSGPSVTRSSPVTAGDGGEIASPTKYTVYSLEDGDWAPQLTLPVNAADGNVLTITSNATYSSTVRAHNILHASTMQVRAGDRYVFRFDVNAEAGTRAWVLISFPSRAVGAASTVPAATSPRTVMTLTHSDWVSTVTLPTTPADRDRVVLRSTATSTTRIAGPIEPSGPMVLSNGAEYALMYVASRRLWVVMSAPDTSYRAGALPNGIVPPLTTPRTVISSSDGNWTPTIVLPANQPAGSRVVLTVDSTYAVTVRAGQKRVTVSSGETVGFTSDASGAWTPTRTIDLLVLFSDKAADQLGEVAERARLAEGLALTNQALENSGANFRFRAVAVRRFASPASWTSLNQPVSELRTHPTAQAWVRDVRADGIYYEGTEEGCGLAWLGGPRENMVATGTIHCGTTVMRHELGHNMGVSHAGDTATYARGYAAVGDVMGGNSLPYYSTPLRYDPVTGVAFGISGVIDGARAMNERSATVASFR